ncbi:hypothetical protein [Glutamicibacter sp.]|uniref:hypothetical protein n=1 Tax=Glutamicibacter sp. TaxID=1931995 RepID=UPI0028BF4E6D|nr:hypothetical protein [Glutamicibacter sp.]
MQSTKIIANKALSIGAVAALLTIGVTGCGEVSNPAQSPEQTSNAAPSSSGGTVDQEALLKTRDQLANELGDTFVQGWIENGELHVSTTSEDALKTIEDAGAIGHVVQYSNADLREGIAKIMQWQGTQESGIRSGIYAYSLNPNTGGITLSVDPEQKEAIQDGLAKDMPAGQIPLDFKDSTGLATPGSASEGK